MNEYELDESEKYIVDVRGTLVSNIVLFLHFIMVMVYTFVMVDYMSKIVDQAIQLIMLIVLMFSVIKLVGWMPRSTIHMVPSELYRKMLDDKYENSKPNRDKKVKRTRRINKL